MKPVSKLDKRNKATSKKSDNDTMSVNCDVIDIFSIYGRFGAIRKPYFILKKLKTELENL